LEYANAYRWILVPQIDTATQMGPEVEMIARMLRMMPAGMNFSSGRRLHPQ